MVSMGIQEASTALIGDQIGALNIPMAYRYTKIIFFISMSIGCLVSILLFSLRYEIAHLFTNDPTIVTIMAQVLPIYCIFNIQDSMTNVVFGCVRALGIQTKAALVTIGCYYIISIPLASILAFVADLGIRGLWIGIFVGTTV